MEAMLGCFPLLLLGAIPLLPLVAKRLQVDRRPPVQRLGRALAFLTLWGAFNASFATIWGALIVRSQEPAEAPLFFLWLLFLQIPALVFISRLVGTSPPVAARDSA
jgi:hypothetical protein